MAKKPAAAETSTELALFTSITPALIVTSAEKAEELFTHIEQQIAEFVPDLTTDTGRRAIASLAFKVSKTKTAITGAAEELIEAERAKVAATVKERQRIETRLDALRDLARKPLTEWEALEAERVKRTENARRDIRTLAVTAPHCDLADVRSQIETLARLNCGEELFGDDAAGIAIERDQVLEILRATVSRLEQQERDRLELEQLRAERAEKARQQEEAEAAQRLAEEQAAAAERAAFEAQRIADEEAVRRQQAAENARLAAEAETRRIEQAAEAAQVAERQRADQALAAQKAAHDAEVAAMQERAQKELRANQEAEERRKAAAKAEADAAAARAQDQENRRKVKADAKNAFMACGADEQTARNIVLSIIAGEIPNVTLSF